jgi:hypothetical protein
MLLFVLFCKLDTNLGPSKQSQSEVQREEAGSIAYSQESPRSKIRRKDSNKKEWAPTPKAPKKSWGTQYKKQPILLRSTVAEQAQLKNGKGVATRSKLASK